jgi:annexin A7/11
MEDPKSAAERLHQALFDKKNKEETCTDIIINNDLEHRLLIAKKYGELYGNPLYEDMKSKLGGHFKELCGYCFLTPMEFNAKMLKRGFKGLSIDDQLIFEILADHTLEEYKQIEEAYKTETGRELRKDIEKNFNGNLRKDILNLMSTERRVNSEPDHKECERLADLLISAGEKKWIEDENIFRDVFILTSPEEMVLVGRYYLKKTGVLLIDAIEKKVGGKGKNLLREVVYANIIPHELFAEKIYNSIKGLGTNTAVLNRVLAARHGVDMPQIKEIYQWKYKVTLKEDIIGDTSGQYQKLCLFVAEY